MADSMGKSKMQSQTVEKIVEVPQVQTLERVVPVPQTRHSHQWAAEALTSVGSRGTHISGQPRHSHQWAAEAGACDHGARSCQTGACSRSTNS